jgi:tetratricopeptide (TPR) repeat protein
MSNHHPFLVALAVLVAAATNPAPAWAQSRPPVTSPTATANPSNTPLNGALRWADSARRVIDRGVIRNDTAVVLQGIAIVDRALTAFPEHFLLTHYRGYAAYRLGQMAGVRKQPETARAQYEEAVKWLDRSIAAQPIAESHALRASCLGQLIGGNMIKGMRLGPQANDAVDKARLLDKDNPRMLLLDAVGAWFKPSMFGGGKDKARAAMHRALAAFATDTPAPAYPSWGYAEALAWHGQWEQDAGRTSAARAAYERALELEPEYGWVKYVLLPAAR